MAQQGLTRVAVAAAVIMMAAAPAQAEEVQGKFVRMERLATHYLLVLEGNRRFVVTSQVRNKNLQLIKALTPGKVVRVVLRNGRVSKFISEDTLAADRVIEREGVFARYDDKLRRLWFTDKTNYAVHPRLGRTSLTTLLVLQKRRTSVRLRVMIKRDQVIEVKQLKGGKAESDQVKQILKFTRIGDAPIRIKIKGNPQYKTYKVRKVGALEIVISPRMPNGQYLGRITWERHKIEDIDNPLAKARMANVKGPDGDLEDPFDKLNAQVGDMVMVGFDKGQLTKLTDKEYFLRLWNGVWGPEATPKPRKGVTKVSPAKLSSRQSYALPGGEGELEVVSIRSRLGRKALEFEVTLNHNAKGVILVDLEARFYLSREPCMGPRDRPDRIEPRPIVLPMFTSQPQRFRYEVSNDEYLDGRIKVEIGPRNVVKITTKAAPKHLIRVLGAMWQEEERDLEALKAIFLAAAENGDESICQHLITRTALIKRDRDLRYALLKGLGANKYKDLAPKLMLEVMGGLDRDLKVYDFKGGNEIIQVPLPTSERPATYKRKLVELLAQLPGCLSGKWGRQLFDLYQTRYQTLGDAIEKAWRASPRQALDTLIPIVLRTRNQKEIEEAQRASQLLRKLGESVCRELFADLRKNGVDPKPLKEAFDTRAASPEEIVRRGIGTLVNLRNAQIAKKLTDMVEKATEHHANKEFEQALKIVRAVLEEKPNHQEAKALLPAVLIDLARKNQKAGNRGVAATQYQEALEKLKGGQKAKAAAPLAEILVTAASEEVEEMVLRSLPNEAADKVRVTRLNEVFKGSEVDDARGWIKVQLKGEDFAYVRKSLVKEQPGKSKEKHYKVTLEATPYGLIKEQLDKAKALSSTVERQADSVLGTLSAREAEILFNRGAYEIAMPLFEKAAELAPTDPRLALRWRCWMKANTTLLAAGGAVLLLGLVIVGMSLFSRPKKVKFQGDYKHYGADRSARERDLDVDDASA